MPTFLDFEKPIAELEGKIEELRHLATSGDINIAEEVSRLQAKVDRLLRQTYAKLTPWQKTLVARHPERPHFTDYIEGLIEDFTPLAGDRLYRRRQRHHRRHRPVPRLLGDDHRPREGLRHRDPREAQFRHGQARRATARRSA